MKSKLPLFVAIAIGIVAFVAIRSYVHRIEQQTQSRLKGDPVVAASTEIPTGAELTMEMITATAVPKQFIPAQAIRGSAEVKQILGRKTRVPLRPGQLVLWSDLATDSHGGLSSIIPEGERAFTVTISKGLKPGLVQPSDHIDIVGSFAAPKPSLTQLAATTATWRQASDMVNAVLLQNVTVLAVGDTLSSDGRGAAGGGDLTLSLTLPEAQLLMFASQHGELGAVLRREGSIDMKRREELPRVTFEEIENIIGDLDNKRTVRNVEIQSGSRTVVVPVSNQ